LLHAFLLREGFAAFCGCLVILALTFRITAWIAPTTWSHRMMNCNAVAAFAAFSFASIASHTDSVSQTINGNRLRRLLGWLIVFALTTGITTWIEPTRCKVAGIVNRFCVAAAAGLLFM